MFRITFKMTNCGVFLLCYRWMVVKHGLNDRISTCTSKTYEPNLQILNAHFQTG